MTWWGHSGRAAAARRPQGAPPHHHHHHLAAVRCAAGSGPGRSGGAGPRERRGGEASVPARRAALAPRQAGAAGSTLHAVMTVLWPGAACGRPEPQATLSCLRRTRATRRRVRRRASASTASAPPTKPCETRSAAAPTTAARRSTCEPSACGCGSHLHYLSLIRPEYCTVCMSHARWLINPEALQAQAQNKRQDAFNRHKRGACPSP